MTDTATGTASQSADDARSGLVSVDPAPSGADLDAAGALGRATRHLVGLQHPQGWWKGELETNVTMDAEDLFLRQFLGILTPAQLAGSARWIRSQQADDGTWSIFYGGPPNLSVTLEAYVALRLAGHQRDEPHMMAAAEFIRSQGGLERTRVFTRIWMALCGLWSWDDLPAMPPELLYLPSWAPLNIYDFACWARQTVVALTVVATHRPNRPLPFGIDELRSGLPSAPVEPLSTTTGRFQLLDRWLQGYEKLPAWAAPKHPLRQAALRRAEQWILRRQEADGCWGGIQPPWVYSLIALHLQGYSFDHPVIRAGLEGLDSFTVVDEKGRRLEACQSPVWDTALAAVALADAGLPLTHPSLVAAADWLIAEEVTVKGDWAVRRPGLAPGGWAFEFANQNYPDIDDTAEVILALRRTRASDESRSEAACNRAIIWTLGMRSRGGGWAAFDADNTNALPNNLPFCDFGEVIDPPSSDVTAHVLEMLAAEPSTEPDVIQDAVVWLSQEQEGDGSWFGRWGANYIYGTGAAVPALIAAGVSPDDKRIRRAVAWLESKQNADGGWGEDLRSYDDDAWRGRGASTASQTSWGLLAMLAAGERDNPATRRAVGWLVETQTPDGTWDEPWFTGTGFPGDFYINYHLYRLVWPVTALGRYVLGTGPGGNLSPGRRPVVR